MVRNQDINQVVFVLLVGLVASMASCRWSKEANEEDLGQALDSTRESTIITDGYRQVGVPQVNLLRAPCGNASAIEVFLDQARQLDLVNQFAKVPATEWRVTEKTGNSLNLCRFLQQQNIDVAYFIMISDTCTDCRSRFSQVIGQLKQAVKGPGSARLALVAIAAGSSEPADVADLNAEVADADGVGLVVSDPNRSLWDLLVQRSPEPASGDTVAPEFILHKSGYGVFSNTVGARRDAMPADFLRLYRGM